MRRLLFVALLAAACSRDDGPARAHPCLAALGDLRYALPDPLLAAARTAIAGGTLDPQLREALLASTDPAHARAQRILLAMETRTASAPPIDEAPDDPPPTRAPMLRVATPPPEPIVASTAAPLPSPPPGAAPPPPPRPSPKLSALGLSRTRKGAALTLTGSGGLVVGIANQPMSGVVHLVMEASAGEGALRSRPRVEGARVTGVRRTGKSVFVTLSLEPGWRLGGIVRSSSGATVNLRRPA